MGSIYIYWLYCLISFTSFFTEVCLLECGEPNSRRIKSPNILLILADDLGLGDLSCYGHVTQEWTGIDDLAKEGIRFTQAYSADSMCTPSRAGLLTGRLPVRSGCFGGRRVFVEQDTGGLPKSEVTVAEMLKSYGYSTGMVGKWHLGINAFNQSDGSHLPVHHGFDYVGVNLPFSNLWNCDTSGVYYPPGPNLTRCFVYNNTEIVQQPIRFDTLTGHLLADWERFLDTREQYQPFFFYFSFPHVHSVQFATNDHLGKSRRGIYGDNLNEMGWAVKRLVDSLTCRGLDQQTIVLFMSDHGPHKELCNNGGSTAGLKGGKSTSFEGGFRIPLIVRMPGTIPPGLTSHAVVSSMDLFPTFRNFASSSASTSLFDDITLDGMDISDYLTGKNLGRRDEPTTIKRPIYFYCNHNLMAIRYGKWKVHFKIANYYNLTNSELECPEGKPKDDWYVSQLCPIEEVTEYDPPLVYDLDVDPFEQFTMDTENNSAVVTMLKGVREVISRHEASVVPVDAQMGNFTDNVIPCCNPEGETCSCDKLDGS